MTVLIVDHNLGLVEEVAQITTVIDRGTHHRRGAIPGDRQQPCRRRSLHGVTRMSLLEVEDLKVQYGSVEALKGISLDIADDEKCIALVGPNGAGKSTFVNAMTGLMKWEGTALYKGSSDRGAVEPAARADGCRPVPRDGVTCSTT